MPITPRVRKALRAATRRKKPGRMPGPLTAKERQTIRSVLGSKTFRTRNRPLSHLQRWELKKLGLTTAKKKKRKK